MKLADQVKYQLCILTKIGGKIWGGGARPPPRPPPRTAYVYNTTNTGFNVVYLCIIAISLIAPPVTYTYEYIFILRYIETHASLNPIAIVIRELSSQTST